MHKLLWNNLEALQIARIIIQGWAKTKPELARRKKMTEQYRGRTNAAVEVFFQFLFICKMFQTLF